MFPFWILLAIFRGHSTTFLAKDRDFIEVFSGNAEISKALREVSYLTVWCPNLALNFGKNMAKKRRPNHRKCVSFCMVVTGWTFPSHQVLIMFPIQPVGAPHTHCHWRWIAWTHVRTRGRLISQVLLPLGALVDWNIVDIINDESHFWVDDYHDISVKHWRSFVYA